MVILTAHNYLVQEIPAPWVPMLWVGHEPRREVEVGCLCGHGKEDEENATEHRVKTLQLGDALITSLMGFG